MPGKVLVYNSSLRVGVCGDSIRKSRVTRKVTFMDTEANIGSKERRNKRSVLIFCTSLMSCLMLMCVISVSFFIHAHIVSVP